MLATLLSVSLLVVSGYGWATYHAFVSQVRHVDAIDRATTGQRGSSGADQNILLIGNDDRSGMTRSELSILHAGGGGVTTDTMMVLHVPAGGSRASGISLPRDSWVNIAGFGMNKLNAAYELGTQNGGGAAGGTKLLIRTIEAITALHIDHFVTVSMIGFYRIAQALGPIQVCLKQPARDPYSGINLPAGASMLSATQALAFVRQRHGLPRGDLDREVRQQYFLSTEFRKITEAGTLLNPFKLQRLLRAVSSSITTDPGLDLLNFAQQVQNLSAGKVKFATVPILGTPTITYQGNEVSIVALDTAAIPGFINAVLGQPSAYLKAAAASPSAVHVHVLNAGAADGAAASNAALLRRAGFAGAVSGSAGNPISVTTIEYPAGKESEAKALAGFVPGAQVAASGTVAGVTLILGSDGRRVVIPSGASTHRSRPARPRPGGSSGDAARAYGKQSCID